MKNSQPRENRGKFGGVALAIGEKANAGCEKPLFLFFAGSGSNAFGKHTFA